MTSSNTLLSLYDLRSLVSFAEQDGAVFSGTVYENLFIDKSKKNKAQSILDTLGFSKSLDYCIADRGANLSPGEKKKLLLSRCLLKDAYIYI